MIRPKKLVLPRDFAKLIARRRANRVATHKHMADSMSYHSNVQQALDDENNYNEQHRMQDRLRMGGMPLNLSRRVEAALLVADRERARMSVEEADAQANLDRREDEAIRIERRRETERRRLRLGKRPRQKRRKRPRKELRPEPIRMQELRRAPTLWKPKTYGKPLPSLIGRLPRLLRLLTEKPLTRRLLTRRLPTEKLLTERLLTEKLPGLRLTELPGLLGDPSRLLELLLMPRNWLTGLQLVRLGLRLRPRRRLRLGLRLRLRRRLRLRSRLRLLVVTPM